MQKLPHPPLFLILSLIFFIAACTPRSLPVSTFLWQNDESLRWWNISGQFQDQTGQQFVVSYSLFENRRGNRSYFQTHTLLQNPKSEEQIFDIHSHRNTQKKLTKSMLRVVFPLDSLNDFFEINPRRLKLKTRIPAHQYQSIKLTSRTLKRTFRIPQIQLGGLTHTVLLDEVPSTIKTTIHDRIRKFKGNIWIEHSVLNVNPSESFDQIMLLKLELLNQPNKVMVAGSKNEHWSMLGAYQIEPNGWQPMNLAVFEWKIDSIRTCLQPTQTYPAVFSLENKHNAQTLQITAPFPNEDIQAGQMQYWTGKIWITEPTTPGVSRGTGYLTVFDYNLLVNH